MTFGTFGQDYCQQIAEPASGRQVFLREQKTRQPPQVTSMLAVKCQAGRQARLSFFGESGFDRWMRTTQKDIEQRALMKICFISGERLLDIGSIGTSLTPVFLGGRAKLVYDTRI